ncbi:hypothetical protein ABV523_16240 [Snodgrassella alvi]|uniref:hypothetical protein n=1 Tax=Snodgrassella alvi TaxID=1196083 RepID=UPI0034E8CD2C
MLTKKQRSQENTVFGVYIKEGLYSLAQSRKKHWMEFFNIFNDKDEWDGVDLNKVNILFTYSVAAHRLKELLVSIQDEHVRKNVRPQESKIITYTGPLAEKIGLVEMDDRYDTVDNKVLIPQLTVKDHLDIIHTKEYAGMHGDSKEIQNRLLKFYENGINWDESQRFFFPDVTPPAPTQKPLTKEEYLH